MLEKIVLGGGCFWCLEAVFQRVVGIKKVVSGYMGGHNPHPQYIQICQGDTGHAEVVQLEFDSTEVSFEQILDVFFAIHDPTTLNRQGNDHGTQYRSVIFGASEGQLSAAKQKIIDLQPMYTSPIVTEVLPMAHFWPAELEHNNYYNQHSFQPYCRAVIEPKLLKLLAQFANIAK